MDIYKAILLLSNMSSDATISSYSYETLKVTTPADHIYHALGEDSNCRAVIISGSGKMFTSGIDLMDLMSDFTQLQGEDAARIAWGVRKKITEYQKSFSAIEKCTKPVIAAVHNGCLGVGVDLITACDIRYCSQDAYFQVKEVDMGVATDVGTLQRLPNIIGSRSLVNELAFTARKMMSDEALSSGLVSRVFPDKASLLSAAFDLATDIASKSPVAVQGTKVNLLYARDHSVEESLNYMATWNMSMLQTEDIMTSAQAALQKKTPKDVTFSKL
ncbi:unnamed protein product [Ranitomeya imitator]|uniref:Uncharacterized protein n=1 Tax=Ranitomeya imitator TaxID=111125 RepID=A0ABN9L012_9NEOB|nr:unnamed protein product [Ranitomeya imitator]